MPASEGIGDAGDGDAGVVLPEQFARKIADAVSRTTRRVMLVLSVDLSDSV